MAVQKKADERKKARLVVQGYGQRHGVDGGGTFAPVCRICSQCILLAIAEERNWAVQQLDVVTAFIHSKVNGDVCVRQGYQEPGNKQAIFREAKAELPLVKAITKELD